VPGSAALKGAHLYIIYFLGDLKSFFQDSSFACYLYYRESSFTAEKRLSLFLWTIMHASSRLDKSSNCLILMDKELVMQSGGKCS
jgi:hypothetical protein